MVISSILGISNHCKYLRRDELNTIGLKIWELIYNSTYLVAESRFSISHSIQNSRNRNISASFRCTWLALKILAECTHLNMCIAQTLCSLFGLVNNTKNRSFTQKSPKNRFFPKFFFSWHSHLLDVHFKPSVMKISVQTAKSITYSLYPKILTFFNNLENDITKTWNPANQQKIFRKSWYHVFTIWFYWFKIESINEWDKYNEIKI